MILSGFASVKKIASALGRRRPGRSYRASATQTSVCCALSGRLGDRRDVAEILASGRERNDGEADGRAHRVLEAQLLLRAQASGRRVVARRRAGLVAAGLERLARVVAGRDESVAAAPLRPNWSFGSVVSLRPSFTLQKPVVEKHPGRAIRSRGRRRDLPDDHEDRIDAGSHLSEITGPPLGAAVRVQDRAEAPVGSSS